MTNHTFGAIILAAGLGTRMRSARPKVLHRILGEPMLGLVLEALKPTCGTNMVIVAGAGADLLKQEFPDLAYAMQSEQLGTAHAALCGLEAAGLGFAESILVANGDAPLIKAGTVEEFVAKARGFDVAFATARPADIAAYGRVVRQGRHVVSIIEKKDYDPLRHGPESGEVNAGLYLFKRDVARKLLSLVQPSTTTGEYYITGAVRIAVEKGLQVEGIEFGDAAELVGVNTPRELCEAEEILRLRVVDQLLDSGVIVHAPEQARISPLAHVEPGAEISGPCEIYGRSVIAAGARIESHCIIQDSLVRAGARILPFTHLDQAQVEPRASVGPYSRLRPGAVISEQAHVGNFVELKKTTLGKGSKASHLTYLGDTQIGAGVNIGAGTITCNYDGREKFPTSIGAGAFIGSNTALVAPVQVGENALVGAGSVITRDVPDGMLAVARARQVNLPRKK